MSTRRRVLSGAGLIVCLAAIAVLVGFLIGPPATRPQTFLNNRRAEALSSFAIELLNRASSTNIFVNRYGVWPTHDARLDDPRDEALVNDILAILRENGLNSLTMDKTTKTVSFGVYWLKRWRSYDYVGGQQSPDMEPPATNVNVPRKGWRFRPGL